MIRNPIDIASRVSPELSDLIESIINRLESDEPVTLQTVHTFITQELPAEIDEAEHILVARQVIRLTNGKSVEQREHFVFSTAAHVRCGGQAIHRRSSHHWACIGKLV